MSNTSRFLTALGRVISSLSRGGRRQGSAEVTSHASVAVDERSPGQSGAFATVEIDPRRLRGVRLAYAPTRDGDPDPGEIVWTWVPFEERDGRGKDRPVVIVSAAASGREFLAVQLTSKPHDGDPDFVSLGDGAWDLEGRPSWARIDRVFRVHADGMRREAASLDADRFRLLADVLRRRYGWT